MKTVGSQGDLHYLMRGKETSHYVNGKHELRLITVMIHVNPGRGKRKEGSSPNVLFIYGRQMERHLHAGSSGRRLPRPTYRHLTLGKAELSNVQSCKVAQTSLIALRTPQSSHRAGSDVQIA
jgi:hypothetical protein